MIKYLCAAALSVLLAACGSHSSESLAGTYGIEQNGQVVPFLKVETEKDKFTVSHYEPGNKSWIRDGDARSLTPDEFQHAFQAQPGSDMTGIGNQGMALAHVPVGWKADKFTAKTGYLLRFMFGVVEVQKMS